MKNVTLILAISVIFIKITTGQEYYSFPTEDVNWNIYLLSTCNNDNPPDTFLLRYTIHGDTTIDEILYSKVCLESGDIANPIVKPVGGLRESEKQIFYRGLDFLGMDHFEQECLLYDFNKQVGDTIYHDKYGSYYSVIKDIDSIQIEENYRKKYKVDNHWYYHNPDYIVEGIGSIKNGLLGHITGIPTCGYHYWENVCFKENEIIKYLNPGFNDCFPSNLLNSISKMKLYSYIKVFPNPSSSEIIIENIPVDKDLVIRIYDPAGRMIIQKTLINERESINISKTKGLITLMIFDKQGQLYITEKIINL
ncbi:MAG: T9SS type A sorting domain-containing protein [Bacteroidetes bacterium]|nr:T9SS type A sorting domain-containing protein [Bacteroidota bacterium]